MSLSDKTIKELDSKQLYYSIISGAKRIFEHQRTLNKINVFPVPDADTGTNLASTMRSIVDADIPMNTPKGTAVAIADAAISGARGNSGIIFAQFLYGLSNEMNPEQTIDVRAFAESVKKAVAYAYDAIANPVEGTILTVIKDWADHIYKLKDIIDDFIRILWEAYQKALESLQQTTRTLEVLARTHVVDAGAKGFVYFLEGFIDFLTKGEVHAEIEAADTEITEDPFTVEDLHDTITFRYCTEALITGSKIDKHHIRSILEREGDSLVVAGSPTKTRVHIHSDDPAGIFAKLADHGQITYQKVEDMIMQHEVLHNRKSRIAILTDSTCDLPRQIIDRYQIHVMPLSVHFGESYYLDRLSIQPETFYQLLEKSETNPSSSQPSSQDFINKYEYLSTHYDAIIGLHLSQAMSGTFSNSQKASSDVMARTGKPSHLFNSKSLTGGLGLIVYRIARAIEDGAKLEDVLPKIEEWTAKSHVRVSVPTLKYIIRSGRVSPFKSFIARMLDLKPVIAIDKNGKSTLSGNAFTQRGSMKKVISNIAHLLKNQEVWEYSITHANNPEAAAWYAEQMKRLTGKDPVFVEHASPVLAANTGQGVACIALMLK